MFRNVALRIVLLPVYMTLLAGTVVHIETADILRSVLTLLILPLTLAGATRWLLGRANIPIQEAKERNRLPYLKTVTLMVVVIAMFASQGAVLFDNPAVVLKMILPGFAFLPRSSGSWVSQALIRQFIVRFRRWTSSGFNRT